jgi:hypothetical protein
VGNPAGFKEVFKEKTLVILDGTFAKPNWLFTVRCEVLTENFFAILVFTANNNYFKRFGRSLIQNQLLQKLNKNLQISGVYSQNVLNYHPLTTSGSSFNFFAH